MSTAETTDGRGDCRLRTFLIPGNGLRKEGRMGRPFRRVRSFARGHGHSNFAINFALRSIPPSPSSIPEGRGNSCSTSLAANGRCSNATVGRAVGNRRCRKEIFGRCGNERNLRFSKFFFFSGISEFVCINPEVAAAEGISDSCPSCPSLLLPCPRLNFGDESRIIRAQCQNKRLRDWQRQPTDSKASPHQTDCFIECELSLPISHISVSSGWMNMHSRAGTMAGPLSRRGSRLKPRETTECTFSFRVNLHSRSSQPPQRRPPRRRRRELHRSRVTTTERPRPPPLSNVDDFRVCSARHICSSISPLKAGPHRQLSMEGRGQVW